MSDLFPRISRTDLDHLDKMVENAYPELKKKLEALRGAEGEERKKLIVEVLPAVAVLWAAHLGIEAGTAAGFALGRWEDE